MTPLKPRQSGRVTKTPQKPTIHKSSRRTPKPTRAPISKKELETEGLPTEPLVKTDEAPGSNSSDLANKHEAEATSRKRKCMGDIDVRKGAKKAKNSTNIDKARANIVKRGRTMKAKPATSASLHSKSTALDGAKDISPDQLSSLLLPADTEAEAHEEANTFGQVRDRSRSVGTGERAGCQSTEDSKSIKRGKLDKPMSIKTTTAIEQLSHLPKATARNSQAQATAPPSRRRKKRTSVVQQSMANKKRASIETRIQSPIRVEDARPVEIGDQPLEAQVQLVESKGPLPGSKDIQTLKQITDTHQIQGVMNTSIPKAKPKSRKKRKPIAKIRRPRKPPPKDTTAKASKPFTAPEETSSGDIGEIPIAATTQPTARARKPLANLTNFTSISNSKEASRHPLEKHALTSNPPEAEAQDSNPIKPKQKCPTKIPASSLVQALPSSNLRGSRLAKAQTAPKSEERKTSLPGTLEVQTAISKVVKPMSADEGLKPRRPQSPIPASAMCPSQKYEQSAVSPLPVTDEASSQPQPPAKKRGRPRKNPLPGFTSTAQSREPPSKKAKPSSSRRKQPANTLPVRIYRPIHPQDAASDSDDPLSLDALYPPKKAPKAVDRPSPSPA